MAQRKRSVWTTMLLLVAAAPSLAEEEIAPLLRAQTVMITVTREGGGPENGSGVILCQSDNQTYILTARHVLFGKSVAGKRAPGLSDVSRIEVRFYKNLAAPVVEAVDRQEEVITKQAAGPQRDLLLLTVPVETALPAIANLGLAPAESAPSSREPVINAIGHRQKPVEAWAVAEGTLRGREQGFLRHSAPITPGFSGGPLFDAAGALIGINVEIEATAETGREEEDQLGWALPIEQVIETIDKWLPPACLASQNPLQELAFVTYRRGMQAVSTKNWSEAEQLMCHALREWPWEGGSLHLQGMRYTQYLPRYHLGLALYHRRDPACGEARRQWDRSDVQGAIRLDGKRYRKMQRLRQRCNEVLQRRLQESRQEPERPACTGGAK